MTMKVECCGCGEDCSHAYCHECTEAQAKSWTDEGRALDKRFALRGRATKTA